MVLIWEYYRYLIMMIALQEDRYFIHLQLLLNVQPPLVTYLLVSLVIFAIETVELVNLLLCKGFFGYCKFTND